MKICQSVVVVTVRIKESLKICQCSSSSSYSANKRVVQNLSDCKTLICNTTTTHWKKECDNGTPNKRVIQNLSGCCSSGENKRVVPNPSECSSGSANKRVVQNLSVCSSSANKIVVQNLSERRSSSAIEMSFEV